MEDAKKTITTTTKNSHAIYEVENKCLKQTKKKPHTHNKGD